MIKVCIAVILILAVLVFLLLMGLAGMVMTGKRQTIEEAFAWQSDHYDTSFYEGLQKEDYTVEGDGGYKLHVQYLQNPLKTDKYMIISHGYTDNRMGSLKYAAMYLDLGYHCIIYDLRGHGKNESAPTTYGILEAKDLLCLIKDTKNRYKDLRILGLHGESLGSATTLTCLKYKPQVDFVVADCGFSDLENVLRGGFQSAHLPAFFLRAASLGMKMRFHYALEEMRPIDALSDNTLPILFLHGASDDFILPKNSKDMAEVTKGYKEIHLIEGAGHAESVLHAPKEYRTYVEAYLKSIGMQ
ncbi:MAG: alpha/beta hydrolase [Lachnospiraceae bacterium]|nr:alpha/beta hydrolase [Lachnospiraceae bacterium]